MVQKGTCIGSGLATSCGERNCSCGGCGTKLQPIPAPCCCTASPLPIMFIYFLFAVCGGCGIGQESFPHLGSVHGRPSDPVLRGNIHPVCQRCHHHLSREWVLNPPHVFLSHNHSKLRTSFPWRWVDCFTFSRAVFAWMFLRTGQLRPLPWSLTTSGLGQGPSMMDTTIARWEQWFINVLNFSCHADSVTDEGGGCSGTVEPSGGSHSGRLPAQDADGIQPADAPAWSGQWNSQGIL